MVLTYLTVVGISSFFTDYRMFWGRYLGVNAHRVLFTDLESLPTALVCAEDGYDPYVAKHCAEYRKSLRQWLLCPARLPCRADPLDPGASVIDFIVKHFAPVGHVGSCVVMRRTSGFPRTAN